MRTVALILALTAVACAEDGAGGLGAAPSPGFEVVERGTEPAGPMIEPSVVLVRGDLQAEAEAANAPAEGAAELIRSWDELDERALLVVYGGTVPDAGTSVRVDDVALEQDARHLIVAATLESEEPALQVVSIAWAAVSLDADLVARADTCALVLDGREVPDAACSVAIPYASK
ncbi:MAG TPA: hypothetical protein VF097_11210 [Actinomycetota bacterium]